MPGCTRCRCRTGRGPEPEPGRPGGRPGFRGSGPRRWIPGSGDRRGRAGPGPEGLVLSSWNSTDHSDNCRFPNANRIGRSRTRPRSERLSFLGSYRTNSTFSTGPRVSSACGNSQSKGSSGKSRNKFLKLPSWGIFGMRRIRML